MVEHIVAVRESVVQVRRTMVGIRASPGLGVVVAMGGERKKTGDEKWGHILHVPHTAHVPLTDVLVEGRRGIEHAPVRRHATARGREGEQTVRTWYTAGVMGRAREWIGCSWHHGGAIWVVWWGRAWGST